MRSAYAKVNRAINAIANAVLVIAVLGLVAVMLAPRLIGLTLEPVLSGSMEPTIKTGALIGIAKVDAGQIEVGDIIGFQVAGMDTPVCHRVVELVVTDEGPGFRTKGDANNDADTWVVSPQDIIGKVYFNTPTLGYVARFIKTPSGFMLMMGLPALAVIALELKSLFMPAPVKRKRPTLRHKPNRMPLFLPFAGGVIAMGLLWGIMAGNTTERTLGSMGSANAAGGEAGYTAQRTIQNKGKVPLVMCLSSEDPTVSFSESYFRASVGRQKQVEITGDSREAVVRTAGYLPLLPAETVYRLFLWNPRLAPLVMSAIWIAPLTLVVFFAVRAFVYKPQSPRRVKYLKGVLTHD
jgi:signal peptidase